MYDDDEAFLCGLIDDNHADHEISNLSNPNRTCTRTVYEQFLTAIFFEDIVQFMLLANFNPEFFKAKNIVDDNNDLLRFAIVINSLPIIGLLLKFGTDPNAADYLQLAISQGKNDVVMLLLEYGAKVMHPKLEVNGLYNTALHLAAKVNNDYLIQQILKQDQDAKNYIYTRDEAGYTVFMYAVKNNNYAMTKSLLKANITEYNRQYIYEKIFLIDHAVAISAFCMAKINKNYKIIALLNKFEKLVICDLSESLRRVLRI